MEERQLKEWIDNFNNEIASIKISFDAFLGNKPIGGYYYLKLDKQHNNVLLELVNEDELPNEIVNRIVDAYTRSKPE